MSEVDGSLHTEAGGNFKPASRMSVDPGFYAGSAYTVGVLELKQARRCVHAHQQIVHVVPVNRYGAIQPARQLALDVEFIGIDLLRPGGGIRGRRESSIV